MPIEGTPTLGYARVFILYSIWKKFPTTPQHEKIQTTILHVANCHLIDAFSLVITSITYLDLAPERMAEFLFDAIEIDAD